MYRCLYTSHHSSSHHCADAMSSTRRSKSFFYGESAGIAAAFGNSFACIGGTVPYCATHLTRPRIFRTVLAFVCATSMFCNTFFHFFSFPFFSTSRAALNELLCSMCIVYTYDISSRWKLGIAQQSCGRGVTCCQNRNIDASFITRSVAIACRQVSKVRCWHVCNIRCGLFFAAKQMAATAGYTPGFAGWYGHLHSNDSLP